MARVRGGKGDHVSPILAGPWLLLFLPVNAALAGFTVILPILILFTYGGSILAVALAQTLYSLLLIPGSLLWGRVCDRIDRRKPLLLFNYLGIAVIFLSMTLLRGLDELLIFYALFGLIAPSGAAASTLLVMERFPPAERPAAFASFQEMSVTGGLAGVVGGFVWVIEVPGNLPAFLFVTVVLAVVSAVMLTTMVPERKTRLARAHIASNPSFLESRLRMVQVFFLRLPSGKAWRGLGRWLQQEATHEVPLVLAAFFLFNLSANLFNTSYTPYLAALGLGVSGIFLVNIANNLGQVFSLPFSAKLSVGDRAGRSVVVSSWGRASGYGIAALLTLLPIDLIAMHDGLLAVNLMIYGILGVAVAFYTTASSLLLFRSLEGKSKGAYLGLNSSLGGIAAVLGAGLSGVITYHFGFSVTFGVAMLIMIGVVPAWTLAFRAMKRRSPRAESVPPG